MGKWGEYISTKKTVGRRCSQAQEKKSSPTIFLKCRKNNTKSCIPPHQKKMVVLCNVPLTVGSYEHQKVSNVLEGKRDNRSKIVPENRVVLKRADTESVGNRKKTGVVTVEVRKHQHWGVGRSRRCNNWHSPGGPGN